ncbi:MAG: helix-turn-helix domain-containing protein [Enterococcus lacertideformus]|uniref:Helix-turn-helix domain-containing protein n=1 Tax=Enterococcus lacertideformus TaxID=2771493 RepID=A0A931B139_9ENTE|nr:helix-turn-helix domain-containing protein [Enterococcus lacertideformus]
MTTHSSLIRKLRKERNLTQEQLTRGISQRGTLAAFESRGTKISFELLVNYLERMNVTLEEYQFLLNNNSLTNKQKLTNYFISSKTITREQELKLLNEYEKTGNIYYRLIYAQRKLITNYLYNRSTIKLDIEEIAVIKNYLEKIETWGHFELTIFSNCLFIFDDQYIIHSFQTSVSKMKTYIDATYYPELLSNFILNGLRLSFNRHSVLLRKYFLHEFKKIAQKHKRSVDIAYFKIFTALDHLSEDDETAIHEFEKGIEFFEWLELHDARDYFIKLKTTMATKNLQPTS